MANVLRIAIVDPNDATRENLKSVLLGMETVWLEAECSRYAFFVDVVEQTKPDIGFIAMDSDPQRAVKLIHETLQKSPQCSILVSSSSTDGRLILESMRAGAVYGFAGQVDGIVTRMRAELGSPAVSVATGGLAPLIFAHASSLDRLDPLLTLRGLQIIHRRNHP